MRNLALQPEDLLKIRPIKEILQLTADRDLADLQPPMPLADPLSALVIFG
jgi:hypothetical protein